MAIRVPVRTGTSNQQQTSDRLIRLILSLLSVMRTPTARTRYSTVGTRKEGFGRTITHSNK